MTDSLPHLDGLDGSGRPPEVVRAAHARGDELDFTVEACERAVATDGLHFVGYYQKGVMSFSVSLLEPVDPVALQGATLPAGDPLTVLRRLGRQLDFVHTRVDRALEAVRSGRLIRMVLRFGTGAVFYYLVRPGEYLVASRFDTDKAAVGRADTRTAKLVDAIRSHLGLQSQNPGGFATADVVDLTAGFEAGWQAVVHGGEGADPEILELCAAAIQPDDVHYVAYYRDRGFVFSTDLLDHGSLARFVLHIDAEERRRRYRDIGCLLHLVTGQMNRSLLSSMGSPLDQLVADVEEGAVYYINLGDDDFLVGVTLDQSRVAIADVVLQELAESVRLSASVTRDGREEQRRTDPERGCP